MRAVDASDPDKPALVFNARGFHHVTVQNGTPYPPNVRAPEPREHPAMTVLAASPKRRCPGGQSRSCPTCSGLLLAAEVFGSAFPTFQSWRELRAVMWSFCASNEVTP